MADAVSTEATVVSEAYAAARELLRQAEEDAAQLRIDADRYARQREQEAELLVAKARRLLAVAEDEVATMIARARSNPPAAVESEPVAAFPIAAPVPAGSSADLIDLDAPMTVDPLASGASSIPEVRLVPTGLDGILASAIAKAVDQSFPAAP